MFWKMSILYKACTVLDEVGKKQIQRSSTSHFAYFGDQNIIKNEELELTLNT